MQSRVSKKPTPLKIYGRGHYACTRCKGSKIKCLGEKPACANCKHAGKQASCHYELRDRKIVIMESDFKELQAQVQYLEDMVRLQGLSPNTDSPREESSSDDWLKNVQDHEQIFSVSPNSYQGDDGGTDALSSKLLFLCLHNLPQQEYAKARLRQAYEYHALEFYLLAENEIDAMVSQVYGYFSSFANQEIKGSSLSPISPILLCHFFALLAYGEQMANASSDSTPMSPIEVMGSYGNKVPGLKHFSVASKLFHLSYDLPNLQYIQNAVLLGIYASNINRSNAAYNFFGVAVRSAVGNGYHRRLEMPLNMTPEAMESDLIYQEKCKRLWWTIFVVDVIWATKLTMPVHVDYTDTDVALPTESPVVDLNDSFNPELLECYVHLAKHMSRINKAIYGPNMRTITVNYITTDSMSQRLMARKIFLSVDSFATDFEETTLAMFKSQNILLHRGRGVANLLIRSNQTMIAVSGPAIALLFDKAGASVTDNLQNLVRAFTRAVTAAVQNVKIFMKLYEYNKLFVLGFWDSYHLFCSVIVMILGSGPGRNVDECNQGYALLKYMAENNNVNAINYLKKIVVAHEVLNETPDVLSKFELNCTISDFVTPKDGPLIHDSSDRFDVLSMGGNGSDNNVCEILGNVAPYEHLGFHICDDSRERLLLLTKSATTWIVYNGLPIHVPGTTRRPLLSKGHTHPEAMHFP